MSATQLLEVHATENMNFWTISIFLVMAGAMAGVSADSQEELGNAMVAFANSINRKFAQMFERFDRLEAKMNQIIENQSGQSEEHPSGGPTKLVAKGESDCSNELRGNPDSGFIGARKLV